LGCQPETRDTVRADGDGATDFSVSTCDQQAAATADDLTGLKLIESRLLTLLEATPGDDVAGRQGLEQTLHNIRRERQAIEVRLSPQVAGAVVTGSVTANAVSTLESTLLQPWCRPNEATIPRSGPATTQPTSFISSS
jgi:hypothetical protein